MQHFSSKETLAALRKALRAAFPSTKFSVTNSTGTGYGYGSVRYTDGPTEEQVQEVVRPYVGGGFDGMTDCEYRVQSVIEIDGVQGYAGTRGVSVSRSLTAEAEAQIAQAVEATTTFAGNANDRRDWIYRVSRGAAFHNGTMVLLGDAYEVDYVRRHLANGTRVVWGAAAANARVAVPAMDAAPVAVVEAAPIVAPVAVVENDEADATLAAFEAELRTVDAAVRTLDAQAAALAARREVLEALATLARCGVRTGAAVEALRARLAAE